VRHLSFGAGDRLLGAVKVGWSRAQLRKHAGDPQSCDDDTWVYRAGPFTGPEVTYVFAFRGNRVVDIRRSAVACRYVQ
jgi:hypothetical protein